MAIDYDRINFQNIPNTTTPISAENLNKMDSAIDELCKTKYGTLLNSTVDSGTNDYNLNEDFNNYDLLIFNAGNYNNKFQSVIVTSSYFKVTSTGSRILFYFPYGSNANVQVYYSTDTKVTVKVQNITDMRIEIIGIKLP